MASSPVVATMHEPLPVMVLGQVHLVVVTNRADVAGEWVRRLPGVIEGMMRIVGVSFQIREYHRHDGFVHRRVMSIHLAFREQVLVYHLDSAEDGLYSPDLLRFLRQPGTLFAGEDVDEGLYLLGLPYRRENRQTMDLVRVAELHGADHLVAMAHQRGMPLLVMLAMGILGIPERALGWWNAGSLTLPTWPLTIEQVEFDVQSAAVAQILCLRAYVREHPPPPA